MAMVSIQFSLVRSHVAARLSSARRTGASHSSAHLASASPPHSSISRRLAITHKLVTSQCPMLSHGNFLLYGIASPALWALLPTSPIALASEQIVESGGTEVVTESGGDVNLAVTILGTAAFVGLVLLTIGVIYLAVSDFLEKRVRDEEAKKITTESTGKKKQKGSVTASRGGVKGFGKKLQDEE